MAIALFHTEISRGWSLEIGICNLGDIEWIASGEPDEQIGGYY